MTGSKQVSGRMVLRLAIPVKGSHRYSSSDVVPGSCHGCLLNWTFSANLGGMDGVLVTCGRPVFL